MGLKTWLKSTLKVMPLMMAFALHAQVKKSATPQKRHAPETAALQKSIFSKEAPIHAPQIFYSDRHKRAEAFSGKPQTRPTIAWMKNVRSTANQVFIENKGQLRDEQDIPGSEILYSMQDGITTFHFTPSGLIYRISKPHKATEREWEKYAEANHIQEDAGEEQEEKATHLIEQTALIHLLWQGANPHPEIIAEDEVSNYFNYMFTDNHGEIIGHARGFKKIIYKNIYPLIDVEYTVHPEAGIKYAFILHAGADASVIRMNYPDATVKTDELHNIIFHTPLGNITDHAPESYTGTASDPSRIQSSFVFPDKHTVGFELETGNIVNNTTTIDPWTVGPPIAVNEAVDDIAVDGSNNVFVYSADTIAFTQSHVTKYNSAGTQQWTLNLKTKYGYYYLYQGDIVADPSGNAYFSMGCGIRPKFYNTVKVDPTGTITLWGSSPTAGPSTNNIYETWNLSFNCDYTKLVQSGGGEYRGVGPVPYHNNADWETVSTATGAESQLYRSDSMGEVIASAWGPSGYIYHLTADSNKNGTLGSPNTSGSYNKLTCYNPATGFSKVFSITTGYSFSDFDKKAPFSTGMNSLAATCAYVYTSDGIKLDQWDANTGAHLNTATITGGSNSATNSNNAAGGRTNSGLVLDKCGNVFVGSLKAVYEYDANLNLINTISGLPEIVFDIALGNNNVLYVCGGATNATSFVAAVNVAACVPASALTVAVTQPVCSIDKGSAVATPTFCGAPYTYSWTGGKTTQTVTGLAAGTYTCVVTGSLPCPTSAGDTVVFIINAPPSAISSTITPTNITCNGACNGSATVAPSGGTGSYTYSWSNAGGTSATASSLCPNTYVCTITDANACTLTKSATITQPAAALAIAPTQTNVGCFGSSSASATASVSGGTTTYTYAWTGGTIGSGQGTATAGSLAAGTYTCTVTDKNACSSSQVYNITQPAAALGITPSQTNVTCNAACNGTTTASTAGGTAPYTYVWTGSASTTATASALCPGNYTCTVTDKNNCSTSQAFTITQPGVLSIAALATNSTSCASATGSASVTVGGGNPAYTYSWVPAPGGGQGSSNATGLGAGSYTLTVNDSKNCSQTYTVSIGTTNGPSAIPGAITNASCNGSCNGSASVNGSGGTGTLTYSWSPSGGNASSASSLCAGAYVCHITDQNGCSVTQNISITQPAVITAGTSSTNATCNASNGTASVSASGGTGTYTYSWSSVNPIGSGQATANISGLSSGTYTILVTDGSNCQKTNTVVVNNAGAPSATAVQTNSLCSSSCNGSITVTASGGNGPYTYSWSPGSSITNVASALCAGTYTCYVRDGNNCLVTQTNTITAPAPFAFSPVQTNPSCSSVCDGSITVTISGGKPGYTYSWTGSASTTNQASALCAGSYTSTVTDANGCSASQAFAMTAPPALTVSATQTNVSCNGLCNATVNASPSGGTSAYTYSWATLPNTGNSVGSLCSGTYSCTVTDAKGCTATQTYNVTEPPVLSATGSVVASTCQKKNGLASVSPNGGSGSYTYSWSPSGGSGAVASPLDSGIYVCTIKDSLGCSATVKDTVHNTGTPPVAVISAGSPLTFCAGGSVTLSASGGAAYSWSNGSTGSSITVNTAGVYTVTVSNVCGTSLSTDTVKVNQLPNPKISGMNQFCSGTASVLTASGGTSYSWNTGATTDTIHVTTAGIYTVTATNLCGSVTTHDTVLVGSVTALFNASAYTGTPPLPDNFTDSSAGVISSWQWAFGDGTSSNVQNPSHTFAAAGTYTVSLTVTDAMGCNSTITKIVDVKDVSSWVLIPNVFTPNDDGSNDFFVINSQGLQSFNCKIYDRWGVKMAELIAPKQGWDGYTIGGLQAVAGTYYYILKAAGGDGQTYDLTGFLMLIRQ
jgi:gliding motility-associated-like protein